MEDDKANLAAIVLRKTDDIVGPLRYRISATLSTACKLELKLLFQLENENLRLGLLEGTTKYAFYNELFNRTGLVDHISFEEGRTTQTLVVVLIPSINDDKEIPDSFQDFEGHIHLEPEISDNPPVKIPFRGRLCCSLMRTDVTELAFEDCEPHQTYVREFSVWNR